MSNRGANYNENASNGVSYFNRNTATNTNANIGARNSNKIKIKTYAKVLYVLEVFLNNFRFQEYTSSFIVERTLGILERPEKGCL